MAVGGCTSSLPLSYEFGRDNGSYELGYVPSYLLRGQGRGFRGARKPARTAHQRKGADCKGDGD